MTRASIIRFALIICFCLGYAACGQKGPLFLPETGETEQSTNNSDE